MRAKMNAKQWKMLHSSMNKQSPVTIVGGLSFLTASVLCISVCSDRGQMGSQRRVFSCAEKFSFSIFSVAATVCKYVKTCLVVYVIAQRSQMYDNLV